MKEREELEQGVKELEGEWKILFVFTLAGDLVSFASCIDLDHHLDIVNVCQSVHQHVSILEFLACNQNHRWDSVQLLFKILVSGDK